MRPPVFLLVPLLGGCLSFDLILDGDGLARGGRAPLRGEVDDGNCIAIIGDCADEAVVSEAWVTNEAVAQVVPGEGDTLQLEGLAIGDAQVVAELTFGERSRRARLRVPIVAVDAVVAVRGDDVLDDMSILPVSPGDVLEVETILRSELGVVPGDGLHTLVNDDGLLILDEDGGPVHRITAGPTPGLAVVTAELDGATLFQVRIFEPK